jgi:DNA-binding GntR family transcriptional regulator
MVVLPLDVSSEIVDNLVDMAEAASRDIASQLRESIRRGDLSAGEHLAEEDLAARFHVSRAPIREALLQLEADGLVTQIPHRGATVARLSIAELEETYLIRLHLEPIGMRAAAEQATPQDVQDLASVVDELARNLEYPESFYTLNDSFFDKAFRLSRYALLQQIITNLRLRTHHFRRQYIWLPGRPALILERRRVLIAAIRSRDLDRVEHMTRESVIHSRDDLLNYFRRTSQESLSTDVRHDL